MVLVKGYAVRYWEIGDEEYFLVGAEEYAWRLAAFAKAMKAVDSSIARHQYLAVAARLVADCSAASGRVDRFCRAQLVPTGARA